jgi:hypothetical protein
MNKINWRKLERIRRNRHRLVELEQKNIESGEPYKLEQLSDFP